MYDNETHETEYRSRNNGSVSPDGSYRYVRPESKEMLYRDATIEPAEDAARMPRHYIPPQKTEKDEPVKEKVPDIAPPRRDEGLLEKGSVHVYGLCIAGRIGRWRHHRCNHAQECPRSHRYHTHQR